VKDTSDPFAAQRETGQPIENDGGTTAAEPAKLATSPKEDRRLSSDEWGTSLPLSLSPPPFPSLQTQLPPLKPTKYQNKAKNRTRARAREKKRRKKIREEE
jgi:hypothetical protein